MTGLGVKLCKAFVEDLTCDFVKYCSKNHVQRAGTLDQKNKHQALGEKDSSQKSPFRPQKGCPFLLNSRNLPFSIEAIDLCCSIKVRMCANEKKKKHFLDVGI